MPVSQINSDLGTLQEKERCKMINVPKSISFVGQRFDQSVIALTPRAVCLKTNRIQEVWSMA